MGENQQETATTAVLVAGGSSSRMDGIAKQLYPLAGLAVFLHSVLSFQQCPQVTELVLVCRPEHQKELTRLSTAHATLPFRVVLGGANRQQSVALGVAAASPHSAYLAIHDSVRPLVTPSEITDCLAVAVQTGAATLGVPAKDTIKVVGANSQILSTPDRSTLYHIQTPQIFRADLYRQALSEADRSGKSYTDDCQLVEAIGHPVTVCTGSYENIKITTREDLALATAILQYRKEGL